MKYINEAIVLNIQNLQKHLQILNQKKEKKTYIFKQHNQLNKYEVIEMIVNSHFDQFTGLFKQEIQATA